MMNRSMKDKKGTTWVSTVLYMMISIAIIGVLMTAVRPKIAEMRDKIVISQTVDGLNVLDETMQLTKIAAGTNLKYNLQLSKGNFIIDSKNDSVIWQGDSDYLYSEIGKNVQIGRIGALTEKKGGAYAVTLRLDYKPFGINVTFDGKDETKVLNSASIPYSLWMKNNGPQAGQLVIDLYLS